MTNEPLPSPSTPYRGIEHYRYVDHPIFFARQAESLELLRSVMIFKGVVLFGGSSVGKSSLINAGLLPHIIETGLTPDRIRVQNKPGEEIVIERISLNDDDKAPYLSPSLVDAIPKDLTPRRTIVSLEEFEECLHVFAKDHYPLLVLDQFEEIITLFEETREPGLLNEVLRRQESLIDLFVRILHDDSLAAKVLFSFREDYLAKLDKLFLRAPELPNQRMRLIPPQKKALRDIIVGPLDEKLRVHYKRQNKFSDELINKLIAEFNNSTEGDEIKLSEVQIVCFELWESADPEKLLADKGIVRLVEDFLTKELDEFSPDERSIAIGLLSHMLTVSNTRNFVAGVELIRMFQREEPISEEILTQALKTLTRTRLVKQELRHRNYFYEIASEFLVPWIARKKADRQYALERRRIEAATQREREEERQKAHQKLRFTRLVLAFVIVVTILALVLASVMTGKQRMEQTLKDEALDAKQLAIEKAAEKEEIISILRRLFKARPVPSSLNERELSDLKIKLVTDELAGIDQISSLLKARQFPPDRVPALIGGALTGNRNLQIAKAAQDLLAEAAAGQAEQAALKERVDQDKLEALKQMRSLMTKQSFPPELVLSLLGPTFTDKDSNPEIANAAKELLAEATAANNDLGASITSAVINDPGIANRVPARVYILIESDQQSTQANQIKAELEKKGYIMPGFEIVGFRAPRKPELRYYRQVDKTKAEEIVSLLKNPQLEIKPVYLKGYENSTKLRPGHYELWLAAKSRSGQDWYLVVKYAPATEERRTALLNLISPVTEREGGDVQVLSAYELLVGPYSEEQVRNVRQLLIEQDANLSRKIVIIKR